MAMEQLHSCHGHVGVIWGPDWMLMHFVLLQWLHGATWGLEFRVRNILKTKQGWFLPTYQVYKCNLSFACWLFSALILTVAVSIPIIGNLGLKSPGWWTVANNNSSQLPRVTREPDSNSKTLQFKGPSDDRFSVREVSPGTWWLQQMFFGWSAAA